MTLRSINEGPDAFIKRSNGRPKNASASLPRVVCSVNARALKKNYEIIRELVPELSILPMVKANAYGHGAVWASRELMHLPKLYGLGVATLEEGIEIRRALGGAGRKARIFIFSGTSPWTDEKGELCELHALTPIIASDRCWHSFLKGKWHERVPFELKFNTGMNRLGMTPSLVSSVVKSLKNKPGAENLTGVLSHLAMGENPQAQVTRNQIEQFQWIRNQVHSSFPSVLFHLGNSASIWNNKYFKLDQMTDVVRPGISLYGTPPWADASIRDLEAVMTLQAQVVEVRRLKVGERIGYGGTYVVRDEPIHAAILSAGYADGIKRALSNQGHAWVNGRAERFLGVVSMDLSAVSCDPKTKVGDWVEILGPHVDIWAQAKAANTIPYELFTSVSSRVSRNLEGG